MASESFERVIYGLIKKDNYYRIQKLGITTDPETQREEQTLLNEYYYPVNGSYIQSIVDVGEKNGNVTRDFGLLLINSLSRGTFIFSPTGIESGEYINERDQTEFTYDLLVSFFL